MNEDSYETHQWVAVAQLFSPVHNMFWIKFCDGYSNTFYTDVETGNWIEQGLGFTELAEKVGSRIYECFVMEERTTRKLIWVKERRGKHLIDFGFCHYVLTAFDVFEIYTSDKRYLCNLLLMNPNSWLVLHINEEPELRGLKSFVVEIPRILEKFVNM